MQNLPCLLCLVVTMQQISRKKTNCNKCYKLQQIQLIVTNATNCNKCQHHFPACISFKVAFDYNHKCPILRKRKASTYIKKSHFLSSPQICQRMKYISHILSKKIYLDSWVKQFPGKSATNFPENVKCQCIDTKNCNARRLPLHFQE